MDYLHDFDIDLKSAFETCKTRIASYSEEFRDQTLDYLEKHNILNKAFAGNCLSFLLPFWLQTTFPVQREICRHIVAGNIFGFLYFLIQDAVMDTLPGEYQGDLLPLGNLLYLDFFEQYRQLFPGNSPFWSYLNQYFREWADSVARERRGYWKPQQDSSGPELIQLAHKAAPLKICGAAACLLNDNETAIRPLAKAIDAVVISFQLLDDWDDWREDLEIGNCSFFLSQVMRLCDIKEFSTLEESHVQTAVYGHDLAERFMAIMEGNQDLLLSGSVPYLPYLVAYHQSLWETCRKISLKTQEHKQAMLKGGFYHFLYFSSKST